MEEEAKKYYVDREALPKNYPTHKHSSEFWESLGRVVATFGFLEGVLTRAIFALTATVKCEESDFEDLYEKWLPKLERSLSDQLGGLIDTYGKAVRENPDADKDGLDDFLTAMRDASKIRNVLCHGSWDMPDQSGKSKPFFVNRQNERFDSRVDIQYFEQVQAHVTELICTVMNSVTQMGWQFPGSSGPGKIIWQK